MRERAFEFGVYATGAWFDNDSNVDDAAGLGLRAGYFFLKDHALEFSLDGIGTETSFDEDLEADFTSFKVGYLYSFLPRARVTPHLMVGAGIQHLDVYEDFCDDDDWWWDDDDCTVTFVDETDPLAYAGAGLRIFVGRSTSLRIDGQAVAVFPDDGDEDMLLDGVLNAGVSWVLSGRR